MIQTDGLERKKIWCKVFGQLQEYSNHEKIYCRVKEKEKEKVLKFAQELILCVR